MDHCDAEISLSEGSMMTRGRSGVFLAQRKEIFQENFFMIAIGIEVHDCRGVAHPCDSGRVVLLVLKYIMLVSQCASH